MNVLLVNIYFDSMRVRYMSSSYVLKAYYETNGLYNDSISIDVHNYSSIDTPEEIVQDILKINPDVIGFSCYVWNMDLAVIVAKGLRNSGYKKYLVMGEPEISESNTRNSGMYKLVDYFIIGEGEISFTNLLDTLSSPRDEPLTGVLYYDACIDAIQYIKQTQRVDMAKIPSIYAKNIVPKELYEEQLVFLEAQRGCKYGCHYCLYHKNLRGVTYRDIDSIRQEIAFLLTERSITSIRFVDPTFSSDLEYAKKILRCFIDFKKRGYKIKKIMIEYEYHDTDEEYIDLITQLKEKPYINNYSKLSLSTDRPIGDGFEIVEGYTVFSGVGLQSFNNESLRSVGRRPIHDDEIKNFLRLCKDKNIMLKLDLILGLPKETVDTYLNGLNVLLGYMEGTDFYFQPAILMILPETILETRSEKMGLYYNKLTKTVYRTNEMDEDELLYCAKITGLMNRIINSPIRITFYDAVKRTGKSCIDVLLWVYQHIHHIIPKDENIFENQRITDSYEYIGNRLFPELKQADLCKILSEFEAQN